MNDGRDTGLKNWRFSVAPMMDWTDRHCRYFHRLLSARALLYTEMVTSAAILHGDRERLLGFDAFEQPVAVQLGGADPQELGRAAKIAEDFGYCEINLNVGCPSDRVQNGAFGACLMQKPDLVAACVAAMKDSVQIPVTIKCRLGVDDQDPRISLFALAERVISAGCDGVIVHARKAWLQGLSPKENRNIPPLDYPLAATLKNAFPTTMIAVNGGIESLEACLSHLKCFDGVMVGRAAYHDPNMLLGVDPILFGIAPRHTNALEVLEAYIPYIARQLEAGVRLSAMTRHLLGLFVGQRGARAFRRHLAMEAVKPGAGLDVVRQAVNFVCEPVAEPSRTIFFA